MLTLLLQAADDVMQTNQEEDADVVNSVRTAADPNATMDAVGVMDVAGNAAPVTTGPVNTAVAGGGGRQGGAGSHSVGHHGSRSSHGQQATLSR